MTNILMNMLLSTLSMIEAILSCDPGKNDYAWALIALDGTVVDTGMIKHVIDDMTFMPFMQQLPMYMHEINKLFTRNDVKIKSICVERLTPRPGMGSGASSEYCNVMIGLLYGIAKNNGIGLIRPVMPSSWKCWLSRLALGERALESSPTAFGFPQVIKNARKSDNFAIFEHQFDAIGIGLWWINHGGVHGATEPEQLKSLKKTKESVKRLWKARLKHGSAR